MQVKILDTLYGNKMCHLVYMQDITSFVGSALNCVFDSNSFIANLTS